MLIQLNNHKVIQVLNKNNLLELQVFMAEKEFKNPEVKPWISFLYCGGAI